LFSNTIFTFLEKAWLWICLVKFDIFKVTFKLKEAWRC
jgi:hypothetical protein